MSGSGAAIGRKDLLQIRGLSSEEITTLLDTARGFRDPSARSDALRGRIVVNCFLEPSTRTQTSSCPGRTTTATEPSVGV